MHGPAGRSSLCPRAASVEALQRGCSRLAWQAQHTPHLRVGQCDYKLDHLVEAIAACFPDDDELGEQLHEDVRLALRFALSFPEGPRGLVHWRRSQTTILNKCVRLLHDLNAWILRLLLRLPASRRSNGLGPFQRS